MLLNHGCTAVGSFLDDFSFHACTFPLPNMINTNAGRIYRAAAMRKMMFHSSIVFCEMKGKRRFSKGFRIFQICCHGDDEYVLVLA